MSTSSSSSSLLDKTFLDEDELWPQCSLPFLVSDCFPDSPASSSSEAACSSSSSSSYRHLHNDLRTPRFRFSKMERKVKMPLKPGRGLMDWIRVCKENPNMGTSDGVPKRVTDQDMAEHCDQENAWMIISGKVYNVGPYMEYHPGGIEQLMRAAGTDGTKLFNEKHPWVNYESMLKSCLVGSFVGVASKLKRPGPDPSKVNTLGVPSTSVAPGGSRIISDQLEYPKALIDHGISGTWKEEAENVQLLLDTTWDKLSLEQVVVECVDGRKLRVLFRTGVLAPDVVWTLPSEIDPSSLIVSMSTTTPGRLSISFQKQDSAIMWQEFLQNCVVKPLINSKYRTCRIHSIEFVTHDTRLYGIDLPDGGAMPVPFGSHVFIQIAQDGSRPMERPYTPVMASVLIPNGVPTSTTVHLLIKFYSKGLFTPKLWALKEGDTLELSDHQGSFSLDRFLDHYHIFLLAAGTGFTPMARIIQACLHKLKKRVTLIFFNKREKDILWRDDLEKLAEQSDQFRFIKVLSEAGEEWNGRKGRVSIDLLKEFLLPKSSSNFVCVCGPNGFVDNTLGCLRELEYDDESVHVFQG